MAANPYNILGVAKSATDAEIKSAYRKLAKKHHPDMNPGEAAKLKFSEISAAYDLLSDKDKRASFDRGEIDGMGQPQRPAQSYGAYAGAGGAQPRYRSTAWNTQTPPGGGASFDQGGSFKDIFETMFGGGGIGPQPKTDAHYDIEIEFLDAARGSSKRVTMPDGAVLDIAIPAGVSEGQQLRLKGKGHAGRNGQMGDAYVTLHIRPHDQFTREGNDITVELPIGFHESVLGASVAVPTIHGPVNMSIPKGATSGQILRLKGKGIKTGDQFVKLKVMMPAKIDSDLEKLVADWAKTHAYNPRGK